MGRTARSDVTADRRPDRPARCSVERALWAGRPLGHRGARLVSRDRAHNALSPTAPRRDHRVTRRAACTASSPRRPRIAERPRPAAASRWRGVSAGHTRARCPAAMPILARDAGLTAGLTPQRRDGAAARWCRRCGARALARSRIDGHRPEVSARQAGTQTAGAREDHASQRHTWPLPTG